jgi:bifunctional non-homologous end joining protein LigD
MPLASLRTPFDHADWIYELKYDGFRALAYIENRTARLVSRNGNVFKTFPDLAASIGTALEVRSAVLDGEIVHLGKDGIPRFYDLMRRRAPQHFFAFDLLWLNGRDLRGLPLLERKRLLAGIAPPQPAPVVLVDHIAGSVGVALFQEVCKRDLEGIVAKLAKAPYTPESTSWIKIKNRNYSQAVNRRDFFDSRTRMAARA